MVPTKKRPPKTIKEKKFIKAYIETGSGTEAVKQVYDVTSEDSARAIASQNFRKLDISSIMDKKGLTDERLVDVLNDGLEANRVISAVVQPDKDNKQANGTTTDFIDVPDFLIRHKYLETALKLKGKLVNPQPNVQVNNILPIMGGATANAIQSDPSNEETSEAE